MAWFEGIGMASRVEPRELDARGSGLDYIFLERSASTRRRRGISRGTADDSAAPSVARGCPWVPSENWGGLLGKGLRNLRTGCHGPLA